MESKFFLKKYGLTLIDGGVSKAMTSVAVAVNGVRGGKGGGASRRAVRWAVENLLPTADRFILVHVMPKITSIPTPSMYLKIISQTVCLVAKKHWESKANTSIS